VRVCVCSCVYDLVGMLVRMCMYFYMFHFFVSVCSCVFVSCMFVLMGCRVFSCVFVLIYVMFTSVCPHVLSSVFIYCHMCVHVLSCLSICCCVCPICCHVCSCVPVLSLTLCLCPDRAVHSEVPSSQPQLLSTVISQRGWHEEHLSETLRRSHQVSFQLAQSRDVSHLTMLTCNTKITFAI